MIEQLKERLRAAGYKHLSIKEGNGVLVLTVAPELYSGGKPRFWAILDDLNISYNAMRTDGADITLFFNAPLPIGEFPL